METSLSKQRWHRAEELVFSCSFGGHWTRCHVQERSIARVASVNGTVATRPSSEWNVRDGLRTEAVGDGTENPEMT